MWALVQDRFVNGYRSRSHQAHIPTQNIKQLRKLVQATLSQESPDARDAAIVGELELAHRPRLPKQFPDALDVQRLVRVADHGSELVKAKCANFPHLTSAPSNSLCADTFLSKDCWATRIQPNKNSDNCHHRQRDY